MSLGSEYRPEKRGAFAYSFEQIILKLQKGYIPEDNLTYFMVYAMRYYKKNKMPKKARRIYKLIKLWKFWCNIKRELMEKKSLSQIRGYLFSVEKLIEFKYAIYNEPSDMQIRTFAIGNSRNYYNYVLGLLRVKQEELLFTILSEIWLCIYADNLIDSSEVNKLSKSLPFADTTNLSKGFEDEEAEEVKDEDKLVVEQEVKVVVDEKVDDEKQEAEPRKIEHTHLCFLKVIKIMKPFLDTFKNIFFRESNIYSKLYTIEIYSFSLLMVASRILGDKVDIRSTLVDSFRVVKKVNEFKFVELLRSQEIKSTILSDLYLDFSSNLEEMVRSLFDTTENILTKIEGVKGRPKRYSDEDTEGKTAIVEYNLIRKLKKREKPYLVGLRLNVDELWAILEMVKSGEQQLREVSIDCTPYIVKPSRLPAITLLIGKTGGGKTVHALNLIRSLLNDGYCVFDISLNLDRPREMIFSTMPLDEKLYPKEFERLEMQGLTPEGLNTYILIPSYDNTALPHVLPSCSKLTTIPLYTLADKQYAYDLLFTKIPDSDIVDLVSLVIKTQADETWDLDTLRYYLKELLTKQKAQIWIPEKITEEFGYEKLIDVEKATIKSALQRLVATSPIISSGRSKTAINFKELIKPGVFVTPYLGHAMTDRLFCFAFITWLFYALNEYKTNHPEAKIAIFCNEAQNIAPSQALVGGVYSKQKFSLSADIANHILHWRGMGYKGILNTQVQSQLKGQLTSQAGLLVVFHTTTEADLTFAFNDILNLEMQENLRLMIVNKFVSDEHICVYKWGSENVSVVLGAMPPCAIERQNIDPFKLYEKKYPTLTVHLKDLTKELERDKKETFLKTHKDEIGKTIKLKQEGLEIVGFDPEKQVMLTKEEADKMTQIPKGQVLISGTKLDKMTELKADETKINIETLKALEETKPISPDQMIIDKNKYFAQVGAVIPSKVVVFGGTKESIANVILSFIVGCEKTFSFGLYSKLSEKPAFPLLYNTIFKEKLDYNASYQNFFLIWKSIVNEHPIISKILVRYRVGHSICYRMSEDQRKIFLDTFDKSYLDKLLKVCAYELYDKFPEFPWIEEVKQLHNIT